MEKGSITYLWQDKKRVLGMPLTFTRYMLSEDRLFLQRGFFRTVYDETVLYRIRDISVTISLGQRLFGVGTVHIHSSDQTNPHLDLINIKRPIEVKELMHRQIEAEKAKRNYRVNESLEDCCDEDDPDGSN